jgi:hypothetical protein
MTLSRKYIYFNDSGKSDIKMAPTTGNDRTRFTYRYYQQFVSKLCEFYSFTTFKEGENITGEITRPFVVMRHDIDMDLEAALRMASLENELRINSTYFFMVRCPIYNVFGYPGAKQVNAILAYGHHLGLHFDCTLYEDISIDRLDGYISKEGALLEDFFQHPVEAVSFHRPGPLELSGVKLKKWPNTYGKIFTEEFKYFADSRGVWAYGHPLDSQSFKERKNLHILTHPIWWTEIPRTPYECLVELVKKTGLRAEEYIAENCQVWNRAKQIEASASARDKPGG